MTEMRKQRKMGHITIVGPSMGIVEARLHSMLGEESVDDQSSGQLLHCGLITASCPWNLLLLKFCPADHIVFSISVHIFERCIQKIYIYFIIIKLVATLELLF